MKEQTLSSPEGQAQGCLQASERLSWGRGTELAVWPQGVKPRPTSGSHYREEQTGFYQQRLHGKVHSGGSEAAGMGGGEAEPERPSGNSRLS